MPEYDGLIIQQREGTDALHFFAFAATAKEILSWADIQRTAEMKGASQRLKNLAHIKTIRAFVEASACNIIPTAVTLAVQPNAYKVKYTSGTDGERVRFATLKITQPKGAGKDKAAVVIDGQHRLLALESLPEAPPLLACAILGADDLERAMHFVVINNKTKRVPSDLVKAIMAELTDKQRDALRSRLTSVGITLGSFPAALDVLNTDKFSPFRKLVDWDINRRGTRRIKPAALESSLRAIIADLRTPSDTDVDDAVGLLCAMWRGVRDSWDVADVDWCANHENDVTKHSKLVDKAGLVAVTEFLIERINIRIEEGFDVSDLDNVQEYCKDVMKNIPSRFWLMKWTEHQLDTSVGRGLIRQSLVAIRTATSSGADDPLADAILVPSTNN